VGNNEIDRQHKKLFELADRFHSAMASGKGKQILQQTLSGMNWRRIARWSPLTSCSS
jgi:hypothetical protein